MLEDLLVRDVKNCMGCMVMLEDLLVGMFVSLVIKVMYKDLSVTELL